MKNTRDFYIIIPRDQIETMTWPEGNIPYRCAGNLAGMLRIVLNDTGIKSDLKIIFNDQHRYEVQNEYSITYQQLNDYLSANCTAIRMENEPLLNRVDKKLTELGVKYFWMVYDYREVILQQAHYYKTGNFYQ